MKLENMSKAELIALVKSMQKEEARLLTREEIDEIEWNFAGTECQPSRASYGWGNGQY